MMMLIIIICKFAPGAGHGVQKALINTRMSLVMRLENFTGAILRSRLIRINCSHSLRVQHPFAVGETLMTTFQQASLSQNLGR
jgi:hypothetical protein